MPSQSVVYKWLNKHPAFVERYTRAREEQAETHADEIVSIADETPQVVEVKDKEGKVLNIALDSSYIQWQRNRIEARKWNAAKQRPKKYGDRTIHAGDENAPVRVEGKFDLFDELIRGYELSRQVSE
jgi:hypothetical protein